MSHAPALDAPGGADGAASAACATHPAWAARVAALERCYRRIQHERMAGLGLLHPALQVQALGFQPLPAAPAPLFAGQRSGQAALRAQGQAAQASAPWADGVLITPWFLSLLRLPLRFEGHQNRVGQRSPHAVGATWFDFLGNFDPELGFHQSCALFSPMQGFDTQARALETAQQVLLQLRAAPEQASARLAQAPA